MNLYAALLVMCILLRSLFVASLFTGAQRMWKVLGIALAWACADLAMVLLAQSLAWRTAAQAFVMLLALDPSGGAW